MSLADLEKDVFGREQKKDEEFGVYRKIVIAQTNDEKIRNRCQDGGVVTAMLLYALENSLIDAAAVSDVSHEEPFKALAKLASTSEEITVCSGTRYTYSPTLAAFNEGVQQKKKSIAFVGTPCQIIALRKIQSTPLKKISAPLAFAVGLFCSECFTYEGLMKEMIEDKLDVHLEEIKKMNIKGKIYVTLNSGEVKAVSLKEAKKYVRSCIRGCGDFSAELADISVGGLGLDGWTLVILRTLKGEKIFQGAESSGFIKTKKLGREHVPILEMLKNFSMKKRENAVKVDLH